MKTAETLAKGMPPVAEPTVKNLEHVVREKIQSYLRSHKNSQHPPADVYKHVMQVVETALLEEVLRFSGGNQSKAATLLGIHRNTLRQKLNAQKTQLRKGATILST